MYYVLSTVEGLHLTCDFVVYSAALYGCPPNYTPTPVGLHEVYRHPHQLLGSIPFKNYIHFGPTSAMDELTLQAMASVQSRKLQDFTCIAFEIELDKPDYTSTLSPEVNSLLLQQLLEKGERILDVIRLFLFKPGENRSIGRVGAIGNGVCGAWLGNDGEAAKFIARKISRYQLVQSPFEVTLEDVRKIYNDPVFKELHSAACLNHDNDDLLLKRIFQSLRAFRESRELQSLETRFLRLGSLVEHLAKRDENEYLKGKELRNRIARIAEKGWNTKGDVLSVATDLWDNARNPLTHSVETFSSIRRDPALDIPNMEQIVVNMIQAVVIAWRNEQFGIAAYDYLLEP